MALDKLDVATRTGAATTIVLLAWLIFRNRGQIGIAATLFAPLAICLAGFVIGNTSALALQPDGIAGEIAHVLSGFTVIFLWWFCLSCFDRNFRLDGGVLGVGFAWAAIAALDRGLFGQQFADEGLSVLLVMLGFGIVAHLVWRLIAERPGDLIQRRHDARVVVAIVLGGMLFLDLAADALFGFAWRPQAFAMAQNIMVLGFGLWLAGRLLAVRPDVLSFGVAAGPSPQGEVRPSGDGALHRRLTKLIEARIFLDPELSFAAFVKQMGASERAVRTLVNHELGYDHFRAFLNHHRVAEARRLLDDPRRPDAKLVAIALDSGFASLASFNRAFRAVEGCSPSQYRAAASGHEIPPFEERKAVF